VNRVKAGLSSTYVPESSVNQKFTEAHNSSLFHLLTAFSTDSGSSKSKVITKILLDKFT
jgi:hypothetical protein